MIRAGIGLITIGLCLMAGNQARGETVTLDLLCSGRPVSLERISETVELISKNERNPLEKCDKYKDSLRELGDILDVVQTGKVCTLYLVDMIRNYHKKYIDNSSNDNIEERQAIPEPLKTFFMSLCFQINAECKMGLINNLEHDTKAVLDEQDYEQIMLMEKYGAVPLNDKTTITDFDDILLLCDLEDAFEQKRAESTSNMVLKVRTTDTARQLLYDCMFKFKPIYDRLIMPLIRLSDLGYNYQGELLERELEEFRHSNATKRWYNIVQICEAYLSFKIYEDPELIFQERDGSDAVQKLTIIGPEEEEELQERNLIPLQDQVIERGKDDATKEYTRKLEELPNPVAWHYADELWIKDHDEITRLIQKYKTSVTEADRIKAKYLTKLTSFLGPKLIMIVLQDTFCSVKDAVCGRTTTSINEDLVKMMDEAVDRDAQEKGLVVEPQDGIVFGGWNKKRGTVSKYSTYSGPKRKDTRISHVHEPINMTKTSKRFLSFSKKFVPSKFWAILIIAAIFCTFLYSAFAHGVVG